MAKKIVSLVSCTFAMSLFLNAYPISSFAEENTNENAELINLNEEVENLDSIILTEEDLNSPSNLLNWDSRDVIFEKLVKFENKNPGATEEEINHYFLKLCKKYNDSTNQTEHSNLVTTFTSVISHPLYYIVEKKAQLNSQEQALYNDSPSKGFKALIAGDEAYDVTNARFGTNGHNDKSDAYRHSAWNIFITAFTNGDSEWARLWTNAHEFGVTDNPYWEQAMDLHNNYVGRNFADANKVNLNSSITAVRSVCDKAYFSGELKYLPNGNNNPYVFFTGKSSDFK
jgi:hypothetical protein